MAPLISGALRVVVWFVGCSLLCFGQKPVEPARACKYPDKTSDGRRLSTVLPPDQVLDNWRLRALHFIAMGVSGERDGAGDASDFAKADVKAFVEVISAQGFQPLPGSTRNSTLIDDDATFDHLSEEIGTNLPKVSTRKRPLLIFYYAGHGDISTAFPELVLWPGGAPSLDVKYAFSFHEAIRKIRDVYKGDLLVILDACHSGKAIDELNGAVGQRIAVLASSEDNQTSQAIVPPGSSNAVSAFTYKLTQILKGADSCENVDPQESSVCTATRSGILDLSSLASNLNVGLRQMKLETRMAPPPPKDFARNPAAMLGYYCETVRDPDDSRRQNEITITNVISALNRNNPSGIKNLEPLGIEDSSGRIIATVTAYKAGDIVSGLAFDSVIDRPTDSRSPDLTIAKINPPGHVHPDLSSLSLAHFSQDESKIILTSIKDEIARKKDSASEQDFALQFPLLVNSRSELSSHLMTDEVGDVTFQAMNADIFEAKSKCAGKRCSVTKASKAKR